ncbi:hypothetical protein [Chakrabartyella piscis]|uniref:hypothetical protein n=1 Tax=Chakrabartyella piscis TaxID=2918914 RepID=UPI002958CFFB|nr:hypothetical protein [Chakrabartyella piscis]
MTNETLTSFLAQRLDTQDYLKAMRLIERLEEMVHEQAFVDGANFMAELFEELVGESE